MKKAYTTPTLEEVGAVSAITAAVGSSTRVDFNEFSGARGSGSFDICDGNPGNNPPGTDFCVGSPAP